MSRVAIVEDDVGFRESLRLLVEAKPGYTLTGVFCSAEEALDGLAAGGADVLLLDIFGGLKMTGRHFFRKLWYRSRSIDRIKCYICRWIHMA